MAVKCRICGSENKISPMHKDFQEVNRNPNFPFICEFCGLKIQFEMQKANDIYNSLHKPSQANNKNI